MISFAKVTAEAYAGLTPVEDRIYYITDTGEMYLNGIKYGGGDQAQADWDQSDSTAVDYIKNKPAIPAAQVQSNWDESDSTAVDYILNKPTIPAAQVQADYEQLDSQAVDYIRNKPVLAAVATTGNYWSLTNRPAVPYNTGDYFTIWNNSTDNAAGSTVKLEKVGSPRDNTFQYRTSNSNDAWTDYTLGTTLTLGRYNFVSFRNKNYAQNLTVGTNNDYYHFTITGDVWITGDITSLKDRSITYMGTTGAGEFISLFMGNICIMDASQLKLPFANVTWQAFARMFKGCTALTAAPKILPAMSLKSTGNYMEMFSGCSNLKNAPILPATTLTQDCYKSMFYNCTSLVETPAELPATTLAKNCYYQMFRGCISLKTAPKIKARTMADYSLMLMFCECTNLNYVSFDGVGGFLTPSYSQDWLTDVSSSGTFECWSNLGIPLTRSGTTVPSGWNVSIIDDPQPDWNQTDTTAASFIRNKPVIPSGDDEYAEPQSAYGIGAGKWKITSTLLSDNYGSITIDLQSGEKAYLQFDLESDWGSGNETVAEISCSYLGTFFLGTKEKQTRFTIPGKYYYIIENDGTYYRLLNGNGQLIQYLDGNGTIYGGIRTRMYGGNLDYSPIPFSNDYIEMPYGGIVSPVVANGDLGIMFSEIDSGQTIDLTTQSPYLPYGTYVLPSSRNPVLIVNNGNTINALGKLNLQNDPVIITVIGDNQSHVYLEDNQTDLLAPSSPWAAQISGDHKMVRLLTWCQPDSAWGWVRYWKDANETSTTPNRVYGRNIMNLPYQE